MFADILLHAIAGGIAVAALIFVVIGIREVLAFEPGSGADQ